MEQKKTELKHYGVLGMKWGVHRAKKYRDKAEKKRAYSRSMVGDANLHYSKANDRLTKSARKASYYHASKARAKAKKYDAKADKIESKNKPFNKKTRDKINKMSTGEAVGKSLLLGSYGAMIYTNARTSRNMSRGKAAATAILANGLNNLSLGSLSRKTRRGSL